MPTTPAARLAYAGAALTLLALPAVARDTRAGGLHLTHPWTRPTPPGAPAGAGYVAITNTGSGPDRLLGGSSPAVARVEVHELKLIDGVMRMRPVAGGLAIAPGQTLRLAPGGYHIMLIGPSKPFRVGGRIPVTLRFERAGAVKVSFEVRTAAPGEVR